MKINQVYEALSIGLNPTLCRLHGKLLNALSKQFALEFKKEDVLKSVGSSATKIDLINHMMLWVESGIKQLDVLRYEFDAFLEQHANAVSEQEQQQYILLLAKRLGAKPRQLRGDKRAFSRWFGAEAVSERFHRLSSEKGRDIAFILRQVGVLGVDVLSGKTLDEVDIVWKNLWLENRLNPLLEYNKFEPIRIAAFHCLIEVIHCLPNAVRKTSISSSTLSYVYRCSLDREQDVWLQSEALKLLSEISLTNFQMAIKKRLEKCGAEDDLFVRRQIVKLMSDKIAHLQNPLGIIQLVIQDVSPAVRQPLIGVLTQAPLDIVNSALDTLCCKDSVKQVRAASILACLGYLSRDECMPIILTCLQKVLDEELDDFVQRVVLEVVADGFSILHEQDLNTAQIWRNTLMPKVKQLHEHADGISVRRHAARIIERVWVRSDKKAWWLFQQLGELIADLPEGQSQRLPKCVLPFLSDQRFGRVLSYLAQQDFGFDVNLHGRPRISRGHQFGFRSWRFLHEFRFPSTDKRQAFRHTTGRIFRGNLRVPSGILAELAQTKVPGEPLFMLKENDWRPYIPLVDELISALDLPLSDHSMSLYSSEGVTEILLPKSFRQRLVARTKLTLKFAYYAELRNWKEGVGHTPDHYLATVAKLGFSFTFQGYKDHQNCVFSVDDKVTQFFPTLLPMSFFPEWSIDWLVKPKQYFFSLYENTLNQLILFIAVAGLWFVGRHVYLSYLIRKARVAMPLVIGGWGTRGKSGTERLKAALFNALGYNVVSKTSGCEAMFVYGYAHGGLREMFLFRPYDKATIWEQANVLRLATKLNGEVFLWECMGLTPSYIEILQQQWMKDDLSTITNTYPDHEDLQGPAGINIPQVMTQFVPPSSVLVTSEEQMLPILSEAAKQQKTKLRTIDWMDAGLLSPDFLSRFPYEEHPYNIALVLEMADELDIDHDFAIKEMADRVVADLGVLKVSPVAEIKGRKLEFTNGMSANERFGCMANWQRMEYQSQDPITEPGVWLSIVVNNRADRVSRSKVFSNMLVNDLMTDFNVLIGTNLDGLQSYLSDDWQSYSQNLTLWSKNESGVLSDPVEVLSQAAKRFRLLTDKVSIGAELAKLLQNLELETDDVMIFVDDTQRLLDSYAEQIVEVEKLLEHVEKRCNTLQEFDQFIEKITGIAEPNEALDEEFRALMKQWFYRKFIVIEDVHASGDEIIERIVSATPPGVFNRLMGVQNIKGTGLDFVYRWQAWELCYNAGKKLRNENLLIAQEGLQILSGFKDFGVLSEEYVTETIRVKRLSSDAQTERFQAGFSIILANLSAAMSQGESQQNVSRFSSGWMLKIIHLIEAFSDTSDAVDRRKKANRIYKDMQDERISHAQAALELQALNKRQKGGWLLKRLNGGK